MSNGSSWAGGQGPNFPERLWPNSGLGKSAVWWIRSGYVGCGHAKSVRLRRIGGERNRVPRSLMHASSSSKKSP